MSVSELPMKSLSSKCQAAVMERTDPVAEYWAALHAHNRGELDGEGYIAKLEGLDNWEPPTCRDFVRKIHARLADGGSPPQEIADQFVLQAARLLERAEATPARPSQPSETLDRMEHLGAYLEHMLSIAADQLAEITSADQPAAAAKQTANSCAATIVVAMEFREQLMAEVDKLREALEPQPIAA